MWLIRISLLLFCTGGCTLACMTNQLCMDFDTAAKEAASDIDAYCPLLSQTIACFAGEGCSESILAPLYTQYYAMCSLTVSDVNTCVGNVAGCKGLKDDADSYLPSDIKNYCSNMDTYKACVEAIMPTVCSGSKVTFFDLLGEDYGKFAITCQNTEFIECQDKMNSAGCSFYVETASQALVNRDFDSLCSSFQNYITCTNTTFQTCDQTLNKADFLDGYDKQFLHYCRAEARECQGMVSTNCSSLLDFSTGGSLCRKMTDYLDCVNRTMKDCDASVKEDTVTGPFRVSYIFQCGPEGTESCSAITTCMASMSQEGNSATPNILQECGKTGQMLSCMDTEFGKCGRSSPRPYTFSDVSLLYTRSCQTMANLTDLLECEAMNLCMSVLPFPSDPVEIAKLYYDPEFWCRLLKMAIDCGTQLTQECRASLSVMSALTTDTEALCYSDGNTTPGPNEQTTVPVGTGFKTDAGILAYLSLLTVVLIQIHR